MPSPLANGVAYRHAVRLSFPVPVPPMQRAGKGFRSFSTIERGSKMYAVFAQGQTAPSRAR